MDQVGKFNKSLKEHKGAAGERLTNAEVKVLTINFPSPHKRLSLGNTKQIRAEMKRVYQGVVNGNLPLGAGTKLVFILDKLARSHNEDEKLRILEHGGIAGAPFVGLSITGPARPSD